MDKEISTKIEEVIKEFQEEELPPLINRELSISLDLDKVFVIYGLRRAGKTYYLYQLIKKLLNEQYSKKQIFYINFEDERLAKMKREHLSDIVEIYYKNNPKVKKPVFFFDEIQEVEDWEKFVRRLNERNKAKIFLTGSSSKLLSREIATALRGRTLSYELLPYSLPELLRAKNVKVDYPLTEKQRGKIKGILDEYLSYGGYPEIVNFAPRDKIKTLHEYLDLIIYRDLVERFDIKRLSILKFLIQALAESFAKEFSVLKYYNFLKSQGRKVSKNTLYSYFEVLEEINFFFSLKKYSPKLRVVEGSLPKVYLTDLGFLTLFGKEDVGRRMENIVALELLRKKTYQDVLLDSFYYKGRGDKEVDFVVTKKKKIKQLIQVCYNLGDPETKNREVSALLKASQELKCQDLLVITSNKEGEEKVKDKTVQYIPLWKWLLEDRIKNQEL